MPERVYQVTRPGRAKIPLSWAFADKRIFPNFAFFGPKVDQIWQFPKIWNQPQVNTYLDYQNLKFGQKMFIVAKVILESHNFLWMHTVLKQMDNLWQQKQFWVHFNSYLLGIEWHHSMMLQSIQKRAFSDKRMILYECRLWANMHNCIYAHNLTREGKATPSYLRNMISVLVFSAYCELA